MWFKKEKIPEEKNILYLSIDGRSIGIALYTGNTCHFSDRRIHIHGETQKPIEVLFKDILYGFKHSNQRPIDEVVAILETPWINEVGSRIQEDRIAPFVVTQDIINNLIYKDKPKIESPGYTYDLPFIIEQVALNGYIYPDPLGKITSAIEVAITKFAADESMVEFIDKSVKEFWDKTKILYSNGPVYIFKISKKLQASNDMYITLGSTDTTIRLYSMGITTEKIIIPFGFQNILESLGDKWGKTSAETTHWIDLFIDKTLNPEEITRIEADLRIAIAPFIENFSKIIENKTTFLLERPINLFGAESTWKNLFTYLLKEKYLGTLFPNIDSTPIIDVSKKLKDLKGDELIATYVRVNEFSPK